MHQACASSIHRNTCPDEKRDACSRFSRVATHSTPLDHRVTTARQPPVVASHRFRAALYVHSNNDRPSEHKCRSIARDWCPQRTVIQLKHAPTIGSGYLTHTVRVSRKNANNLSGIYLTPALGTHVHCQPPGRGLSSQFCRVAGRNSLLLKPKTAHIASGPGTGHGPLARVHLALVARLSFH